MGAPPFRLQLAKGGNGPTWSSSLGWSGGRVGKHERACHKTLARKTSGDWWR